MTSDDEKPGVTGRLNLDQRRTVVVPALGSFDSRFASRDLVFHSVPYNYVSIPNPTLWRVILKFGAPAPRTTVGLDIYSDITIGRGIDAPDSPDIDLTNLNALEQGVSRRHAMLRPTLHKLFVIDLNSTNGTYVNAIPVSRGMAQVLRSHDAVSLAGLSFVVEIMSSPRPDEDEPPPSEAKPEQADAAPTLSVGRPKVGTETYVPGMPPPFRLSEAPGAPQESTRPMHDLPKPETKPKEDPNKK